MVGFDELRNARLEWLIHPLAAWVNANQALEQAQQATATQLSQGLRHSEWKGDAANGAFLASDGIGKRLSMASIEASAMVNTIRAAIGELTSCQTELRDVIERANAQRFTVGPGGSLAWQEMPDGRPATSPEDQAARNRQMAGFQEEFQRIVQRATAADAKFAGEADRLHPADLAGPNAWQNVLGDADSAAGMVGTRADQIPKNPAEAAKWWAALTDEQRETFVEAYPGAIGSTDGLPSKVRDEANRIALAQQIEIMQGQTPPPGDKDKHDSELARLLDIDKKLVDGQIRPAEQQLRLLKFAAEGEGRVILAVGDPDVAPHVAVFVPGTKASSDNSDLDRVYNLQSAADRLTPGVPGDVATILWLDYDAPDTPVDAVSRDYAAAGAPILDSFLNGLQAQNGDTGHVTVLGHSYGSTVIGDAARRGDGIAVDDIVALGSPGMHVDSADDLGIDPRHVWAEEAPNDPVPELGAAGHGGVRFENPFRFDMTWGGHGPGISLDVDSPIQFVTPTSDNFGANRMTTNDNSSAPGSVPDIEAHSSYWDQNPDRTPGVSLENQARVIMGEYNNPEPRMRPQLIDGRMPG
ncbi:alpha/beta hydrolase [Embleya sp. NPDC050493]|uniref:alpha/beta hydrolase n=1 Tax=Embleya sp. NPDC050493 TaxID=3363989 RepID=UPI0037B06731